MTKKKAPAPAAQKAVAEKVTGEVKPVTRGDLTSPHLFTTATAPKNGTRLTFTAQNGKTVSGIVAHSFEADGKTVIGFKGVFTPEK